MREYQEANSITGQEAAILFEQNRIKGSLPIDLE